MGYTDSKNNEWGCWFYAEKTKELKTGKAIINKIEKKYTISYELYDRFGSKVSGVFADTLKFVDATKQSSAIPAAKIKGTMRKTKSFFNTHKKIKRIKPFGLN
jgi:hypothetical protein